MKLILFAAAIAVALPAAAQETAKPIDTTPPQPAGYQPPPQPPVPPGVTPVYVQAPPPEVAFPPPPPQADYPFCKRGQFDKCKQRNDPK